MSHELEPAQPRKNTVVFDLGGVVCRFFPDRRLDSLARISGLSVAEVHSRLFGSGFDQDCDRGRYTLEEQIAEIRARLGVPSLDQSQLVELWAQTFEPDPQVLAIADRLRTRTATGLLTNNSPLVKLVIETRFPQVMARFDEQFFSYHLGATKPDPRSYLAMLDRLKTTAGQCLVIDDAEQNVDGARALGIGAFRFISADLLATELHSRALI